jgi:uncharacterized membrane protein (DUF106 family)
VKAKKKKQKQKARQMASSSFKPLTTQKIITLLFLISLLIRRLGAISSASP